MGKLGSIIATSASLNTSYAEKLIDGIKPEQFGRFARPGGMTIKSNHPAWVFGHLSLYPAKVLDRIKAPLGAATIPAGFEAVFVNGTECKDDPTGAIYPPMEAITTFFFTAYQTALSAVVEANDDLLVSRNPAEGRMGELFPTLASVLIFYITGHTQMHLGQVSAWRRAMGLPPA